MLRDQLAQMSAELAAIKADHAKDKQASTTALAEANTRAERAGASRLETEKRLTHLLDQAASAERDAYDSAKSTLERASKAEGTLFALEKRISEQDTKIGNLQQLTAAQKQKAAQNQQKIAEGEKKVRELESQLVSMREFEAKAAQLEEVKRGLRRASCGSQKRKTLPGRMTKDSQSWRASFWQ